MYSISNVHVYMYICVDMYVCAYVCLCTCVYMSVCIYVSAHAHKYVYAMINTNHTHKCIFHGTNSEVNPHISQ